MVGVAGVDAIDTETGVEFADEQEPLSKWTK
jgi:hypothetical protein